ncbi:subtilisin-like protease 4 [Magnolia sinica]|uniref:subtilisin-like protease 4 n=1 Tax=Magnolia sinica TaxID=86752 RepID=UPI00265AFC4C|nr:subtilisin-like protease 4 [Magnolia sinica]
MVFSSSEDREDWHRSFLPVATASSGYDSQRMVYSYRNVISGFTARLTEEEVKAMESMDGFVSARPDRLSHLMTTRTPAFLGLHQNMGFWKDSNFGEGVIIGVVDSGVLPSHPSFGDGGMPPPPSTWKGSCEFNKTDCNNKIIGARSFNKGIVARKGAVMAGAAVSPLDDDGHGTHTASTAAGTFVQNANALGNANGTAAGIAPLAHLAIYRVCFGVDCTDSDILAGIDSAVEDGVDVISISLVVENSTSFSDDAVAIASFGATEKGIFVSCAAANSGPFNSTLANDAPWILTVGASTMDRSIIATVKLGNGKEYNGQSLFQPKDFRSTQLPLVYPGANGNPDTMTCEDGSLNGTDVKGKIVLCNRGGSARTDKGVVIKNAGGAGMILLNRQQDGFNTEADPHVLPASHVSFTSGLNIKAYVNSTYAPTAAVVFKGTVLGTSPAPAVASFSSRGPSIMSPGILKPDIIGPGVNVLAAWPFQIGPSASAEYTPSFNVRSGTSMSAPHLSGAAALIKSAHPNWSPAAIKSAIMTTADLVTNDGRLIVDENLRPADLFATGAGHMNPSKASNPGLIYDLQPYNYISYLCGLGYTDTQVGAIACRSISCSNITSIVEGELNYPSFLVRLGPTQTFHRTVTNVGKAKSTYSVKIVMPQGVNVVVEPDALCFSEVNQEETFSVTFSRTSWGGQSPFSQGFLKWVSSETSVRSPISIIFM